MLSDGINGYLLVEWNPMGSLGIQRSPSMSIGITGLVVNLTSDKCSIHEICLVLRVAPCKVIQDRIRFWILR